MYHHNRDNTLCLSVGSPCAWAPHRPLTILNLCCRDAESVPPFVLPLALLNARITAQRHQQTPSPRGDSEIVMLSSALALLNAGVPQVPAWDQHPPQPSSPTGTQAHPNSEG